jgi:hypothetical protein
MLDKRSSDAGSGTKGIEIHITIHIYNIHFRSAAPERPPPGGQQVGV